MQLRTLPDRTSILPDNERAADVTDRKFNIAVAGATGLVGETMLSILEERRFPVDKIAVLASANSAGKRIRWRNRQLSVTDVAGFDFAGVDIALFSAGRDVSGNTRRSQPRLVLWLSTIRRSFVTTTMSRWLCPRLIKDGLRNTKPVILLQIQILLI